MSPVASDPTVRVTDGTAYGFTSPFDGVVDASVVRVALPDRNDPGCGARVEAADCSSGDSAGYVVAIPPGTCEFWLFDPHPATPTPTAPNIAARSTRVAPVNTDFRIVGPLLSLLPLQIWPSVKIA
jgi:hypothetical protein